MNYKKILLVTVFLLAILTIGAVSASEGADNMTAGDDGDAVESPIDENEVVALDSDDEVVGDGPEDKYNATITVYMPDEVYYGDEINIYGSVEAEDDECEYSPTGEVILYLNDEEIETADGYFDWYYNFEEFGEYNFKIEYTGNDNFNSKEFQFTYNLTNTMYRISLQNDIGYGSEKFLVWTQVLNPENIEITVNGKKFNVYVDDDSEEYACDASALNYGLNTVKIYYPGDEDFGEYSADANITVLSYIDCIETGIDFGDSAEIYVELPEGATGTLKVYSREYDEDYNFIDTEIASADAKDGVARVLLNDLSVGYHRIYANFTGSVEVEEYNSWIDVEPIIKVPKTMLTGEDAYVVVETSKDASDLVEVYYLINPDEDYDEEIEYTFLASANTENGQAKIPLSALNEGYYSIRVEYYSGEDSFRNSFRLYVVDEYDVGLNISYCYENVLIGDEGMGEYEIAPYADGNITIIVDGKVIDTWAVDENSYYFYFNTTGLSVGEHTLTVNFTSEIQGTSSDEAKFNMVPATVYIPDKMYINGEYASSNDISVWVSDLAVGTLEILIDGEQYLSENVNAPATEEVSLIYGLSEVSRGKHNVTVIYSDDKYGEVTKSKTVDFGYEIIIYMDTPYGVDNIITVKVPADLGNGDLTITLDGNKVDFVRNSSQIEINPSKLTLGNHTVIVKYAGDDFYPAAEFNDTFEVYADIEISNRNVLIGSDEGVSLILPGDAKGKLNVTVLVEVDDDEGWRMDVYDSQLVSFVNGKAYYSFAALPEGYYSVEASYTGDDYQVWEQDTYFEVTAMDMGDDYLELGENKTIIFVSQDDEPGQLRVIFSKIKDDEKEWDDPVNIVEEFYVPIEDGKAIHTFTNLQMGVYHIFAALETMDGDFKGFQTGFRFYVQSPYIEAQTGSFDIGAIPSMKVPLPDDANGKINVVVYENYSKEVPDVYKTAEITVSGPTTIDLNTLIKDEGKFKVSINYTGNYGTFEDDYFIYKITGAEKLSPGLEVTVDSEVNVGDDVVINVSLNQTITGDVLVSVGSDDYTVNVVNGKGSKTISELASGTYQVTATFDGNDAFSKAQSTASFKVNKVASEITINVLDSVVEGSNLTVDVAVPSATGVVVINGKEYDLVYGAASTTISNVEVGEVPITVTYSGDDKYLPSSANKTVTVIAKNNPNLQITVADINVGQSAVVNVVINENVTGTVSVNGDAVAIANGKGSLTISDLAVGEHTVNVAFTGDAYFIAANASATFKVSKVQVDANAISLQSPSKAPVFSIILPGDATGTLTVTVDGKTYTEQIANGNSSITISDLPVGEYLSTVTYSGDAKYESADKTVNVSVIVDAKITAKNTKVLYTANGKYTVTVYGTDGNPAENAEVIFKIAGKQVAKIKTDANGVAAYTVKNVPGTYKISATALGVTVTKTLTVNKIVTLKSVTVKKSAKKLVLQATLKKVNGKYLKNKKITFKFNGKKYTAKTNAKGVAKVTIKSSVLKKLKVGKKVTYQATYSKDTVKKTVKIKK